LVFFDELESDDRTGDRQFGWADEGVRAIIQRWFASRTRVSCFLVYTLDGYIAITIFEGTGTSQLVEDFIVDELLSFCNAYFSSRFVFVLDNAFIHY
ncbi:hypothetical protein BDZ45DRAFT_551369, partial [Acephala macrosclerotiorum]